MSTPQVLVVEDEKIVATDIRENLKTLGYSVPAVISSGEEAISFASESRPDLVLMDIQLKGRVDGIEAAKIVQGRLNIPVVFITAFADDPTLQRAKATDPFGYILKPFGKKELQTSIEIALHKHQRERRTRTNEEWLMSLVKSMDEGLIAVDKTGSVCLMNPAAEEITGGSLEDTLGALWSDVLEFTNRRSSENPFSRALETNTTVHLPDCPVRFKRTERHATLTASVCPLLAGGSGPTGAIFCFREHTAQQLTERQFQQARHLESLQRLAGGIAHNLNNVLTVISGYSESLLSQFPPNAPGYRDVRMIQQANDRACGLSQQLLAFSRRHSVHAKLIHLNEILRNSESMIRQIVGPSIEVSYALDPDLGAAEVDLGHLEQVIMTLAANARDAMPLGGSLFIRTENIEMDLELSSKFVDVPMGQYVCLEFQDTGTGIDYGIREQVFEPFFTTKERTRYSGLGLATAYGMVKQAGGHIWLESAAGQGTRFRLCLPRAKDGRDRVARSISAHTAKSHDETILISEEEPEIRLLMRETLLQLGYRVVEANSGAEALKICEQEDVPVQLVITDLLRPDISGLELANRLSSIRPAAQVLFVSAYSQYALRHHGAIREGHSLLQKPFHAEALAAKVREILDAQN